MAIASAESLRLVPGGGEPAPRTLPHNDEAEMALLGALLQNNRAYERVEEFLRQEHFANRIHGRLFEAIGKLRAKGVIADQITLRQMFEQDGDLAEVGGWAYIMQVSHSVVSIINAEDYAHTIQDLYLRRQLFEVGEEIVNDAFASTIDSDAKTQIEDAERKLSDLADGADDGAAPVATAQVVRELLDHVELVAKANGRVIGISTGIDDLDRLLGGMQGGDLILLAGRPSMGKSDLVGCIADNVAGDAERGYGIGVGFFTPEMSRKQQLARSVARITKVPASRQLKANPGLSDVEMDLIVDATNRLAARPLFYDHSGSLTVGQLRARARRLKRQHKIGLIVVDYLQLMLPDRDSRTDNRTAEVSQISRGLKIIARDLDVPVIALSQLSRAVENREDKRPHLADLRESGTLEQDADAVGFIYREIYYLEKAEPRQRADEQPEKFEGRRASWQERVEKAYGKADVYFDKVRLGAIGAVELAYNPAASLFTGLYREV